MAKRIDFTDINQNDPRFYEADPDNPNTNISASRFDVTDPTSVGNPIGEKYNEFLRTANIGDSFDFGDKSGTKNTFIGFNKMGTPMLQTSVSDAYSNWRQTLGDTRDVPIGEAIKRLTDVGYDETFARYLIAGETNREYAYGGSDSNKFTQIGAMADGTPIYGYDSKGKPVTSPTGSIYSTTSSSDAIAKFNSGSAPLSASSSATTKGAYGATDEKMQERQSAYDLLYSEFKNYGLESLIEPLKGLIISGSSPAEFTIKLRESEPYKQRFSANSQRVASGLRALSEAEYIQLEDQYQDVMRRYGLPETYYTKGNLGKQQGFEKFLAGDVSPVELEDRIATAQKRVLNANPEVTQALKQFYPDITNADILAYTLDPKNAIENIKRKVTTAEIGGAFLQAGLQTGLSRADELRAAGVTKDTAQQGAGTIAGGLQRGSQLAAIYGQDPYTQTTAETEVFNIAGAQEARKQRQKITGLEQATFGARTGISSGALARDRAGAY